MEIYLYLDHNTFLHRLDPRSKIWCAGVLFGATLVFNHPLYLSILFSFIFTIILISKSLINVQRLRIILFLLFLFSTILWPFFVQGDTLLFNIGILRVSYEALLYGVGMGLRLSSMLLVGIIFLSTTKIEEFTWALQRWGLPFPISFAISFAFRLVPTFIGTASTVWQAQKVRGLDLDSGNILQRLAKHFPLIIPIFIHSIRSCNLLAMALETKGFGKNKRGSEYIELRMRLSDYLVILLLTLIFLISLYLRIKGYGVVLDRI